MNEVDTQHTHDNKNSSHDITYVLYYMLDAYEEQDLPPEMNFPNAFQLTKPKYQQHFLLADLQAQFPLGKNYHFAIRTPNDYYIDLMHKEDPVPSFNHRYIMAKIYSVDSTEGELEQQPALDTTSEKKVDTSPPPPLPIKQKIQMTSADDQRSHLPSSKAPFSTESVDSYPQRDPPRRKLSTDRYETQNSRELRRSAADTQAPLAQVEEQMDYLKSKATDFSEQALDYAKNIKLEDAKKVAKQTAKQAKKWTGGLFSSISSTIQQAGATLRNETYQFEQYKVIIQRQLAEGAFGKIFLVKSASSNEYFAMKQVCCQSQEVLRDMETELHVLKTAKHRNIIPLVDVTENASSQQYGGHEFLLLFPYYDAGSLGDILEDAHKNSARNWPFDEMECLRLFYEICKGVEALHHAGWCHRDIKPHNVMLEQDSKTHQYHPVLLDFGSCSRLTVEITSRKQYRMLQDDAARKSSAPYRAPELFEMGEFPGVIDGHVDVWSLGCLLYCMAFGHSPFESSREGFMKLACLNGNVDFPHSGINRNVQFSHNFCEFIEEMLHPDPHERPTILDVIDVVEDLQQENWDRHQPHTN